jgi:predicted cupin superfamily sugar epimerase
MLVQEEDALDEDIDALVRRLDLSPHPEGGFYRETYRASDSIAHAALDARFKGDRAVCTAIYYLIRLGDFSAFHRIASDEVWHFYAGASLTVHCLNVDGSHDAIRLGARFDRGETPQAVVRAGTWFGARIEGDGAYSLVGCTVAPGFDFADFELATRLELLRSHPNQADLIEAMVRED